MGIMAYLICSLGNWSTNGHGGEKILLLVIGIVTGITTYFLCTYWVKNEEFLFLLGMLRKKK
jgi:hypothetical protein